MQNLAELPLGSTHTIVAIGYIEHYELEKLVLKLDEGTTYQAGEYLEEKKEQLTEMCKIAQSKTKLSQTRKKFAVGKIVQHGDWAGVLDCDEVPLLSAKKKRSGLKVLNVKPVKHKGLKRKLQL